MKIIFIHFSAWHIILLLLAMITASFLFYEIRKWRNYLRIIRFREKMKPGDYCSFLYNGRKETGYITNVWPAQNTVRVRHQGTTVNLKFHEIFP